MLHMGPVRQRALLRSRTEFDVRFLKRQDASSNHVLAFCSAVEARCQHCVMGVSKIGFEDIKSCPQNVCHF